MEKEKRKILSFHPYSLYSNGGGNRILRRLYEGHESEVICLVLQKTVEQGREGKIKHVLIKQFPLQASWHKWYLRKIIIWIRDTALRSLTIRRIKAAEKKINYDILHVVNHDKYSSVLCSEIVKNKKELWVSFHDYFSACGSAYSDAHRLWNMANRRFVISKEMGTEYSKLFGSLDYEILTDGLYNNEINTPLPSQASTKEIIIYFAGLLHIDYLPIFRALAEALELLVLEGFKINLILRGTQKVEFLNNRSFKVIHKPVSLDSTELQAELNVATILYLPIKFTDANFYLYSLSTKMVGYLGARGAILYHGPDDSAAATLLRNTKAAVCCSSFDKTELANSIRTLLDKNQEISVNAKKLAKEKFDLTKMQEVFWHGSKVQCEDGLFADA